MTDPAPPPPLSKRLDVSPFARFVLSYIFIFVVVAMVLSNMPASALKRAATPIFRPFLQATGLNQEWHLFAPRVPRTTRTMRADISYDDGSKVVWWTPKRDPFVGVYSASRWRKLTNVALNDSGAHLRPGIAAWLARTHVGAHGRPTEVRLYKAFYNAYAPGSGRRGRPDWHFVHLYTWHP